MKNTQAEQQTAGYFSATLVSELQILLERNFGQTVSESDAQQIGLRIAEFVYIKNRKCKKEKTLIAAEIPQGFSISKELSTLPGAENY